MKQKENRDNGAACYETDLGTKGEAEENDYREDVLKRIRGKQ
jgi:hypothetical protein